MPINPLARPGANVSQQPPSRPIPVPIGIDDKEATFVPYRGSVDHGVDDNNADYNPELNTDYNRAEEGDYHEFAEPAPVPVRVVSDGSRERKMFRVTRQRLTVGAPPALLSGQNDKQKSVSLSVVRSVPRPALTNFIPLSNVAIDAAFSGSNNAGYSPAAATATVIPAPWDASKSAIRMVSDGTGSQYIFSPVAIGMRRAGDIIHWRVKVNIPATSNVVFGRLHTRAPNVYYPAVSLTGPNALAPYQEITGSTELQFDSSRLDVTVMVNGTAAGDIILVGDWQFAYESGRFDPNATVNSDGTRTTFVDGDGTATLWVSDDPSTANRRDGYAVNIKPGTTLDISTERAVYASIDVPDGARVPADATVELSVLTTFTTPLS